MRFALPTEATWASSACERSQLPNLAERYALRSMPWSGMSGTVDAIASLTVLSCRCRISLTRSPGPERSRKNAVLWGDRGFESFSLQRRVHREPDFQERI